jgi:hypothetical protein
MVVFAVAWFVGRLRTVAFAGRLQRVRSRTRGHPVALGTIAPIGKHYGGDLSAQRFLS